MEEVALKDLDPRLQKQIENARKAVDKNPSYAVDIMSNIVARHPECLDARKILRQAQQRATEGKSKGFGGFLSKMTSIPFSLGSDAKIKKDPAAAMASAEEMLNTNPSNVTAHKVIGSAAEALELFETAAFAYEEIRKIEPKNAEHVKALMSAYIHIGKSEEAIRVGDAAYHEHPADDEIQSLIKKASVEQSINKGKWEDDESFRDKLKDEEESQKLEQAGRAKTGEAGLRSMIEDAKAAVAEEPGNINFYRDISSNYRKLGDFDNALEWIGKARQLEAGSADVNLERLEGTLKREKMATAITAKEEALEANPESAAAQSELEALRHEERVFRLAQAEDIVQRYPNEYGYRYELGELYHAEGETDKAIKELQLAQRSPKVRINALILLGKAYKVKGFSDLAAEQLTLAKSEIPGITDQKKDVLYELGSCYEEQGDMDKAMVEFKALYGADISYRDVSQKIDDFYSKKS
ncbi:MAG: tetratricopeptide (TPR) repeat protein [Lentimonas sp.]|jgi:tetratricopeptide (TPR) repeat protein